MNEYYWCNTACHGRGAGDSISVGIPISGSNDSTKSYKILSLFSLSIKARGAVLASKVGSQCLAQAGGRYGRASCLRQCLGRQAPVDALLLLAHDAVHVQKLAFAEKHEVERQLKAATEHAAYLEQQYDQVGEEVQYVCNTYT
jgi:hypothetical protein